MGSGRAGDASTFIDTTEFFNVNKTYLGGVGSEHE